MGLFNWAEEKIQNMSIWEFGLTKAVLIIFGIIIGAYISVFVKQNIIPVIVVLFVLYIILINRVLSNKKGKKKK